MQAGLGIPPGQIKDYILNVVEIVVQLKRGAKGRRYISQVYYKYADDFSAEQFKAVEDGTPVPPSPEKQPHEAESEKSQEQIKEIEEEFEKERLEKMAIAAEGQGEQPTQDPASTETAPPETPAQAQPAETAQAQPFSATTTETT